MGNPTRGSGERRKLPQRGPAENEFGAFQLENMTRGGNNFNDFPENPLTKIACSLNSRLIKAKWFTKVCGAVFKKPLATGLFVLICVIDVVLHYFCSTSIVDCHFHTC